MSTPVNNLGDNDKAEISLPYGVEISLPEGIYDFFGLPNNVGIGLLCDAIRTRLTEAYSERVETVVSRAAGVKTEAEQAVITARQELETAKSALVAEIRKLKDSLDRLAALQPGVSEDIQKGHQALAGLEEDIRVKEMILQEKESRLLEADLLPVVKHSLKKTIYAQVLADSEESHDPAISRLVDEVDRTLRNKVTSMGKEGALHLLQEGLSEFMSALAAQLERTEAKRIEFQDAINANHAAITAAIPKKLPLQKDKKAYDLLEKTLKSLSEDAETKHQAFVKEAKALEPLLHMVRVLRFGKVSNLKPHSSEPKAFLSHKANLFFDCLSFPGNIKEFLIVYGSHKEKNTLLPQMLQTLQQDLFKELHDLFADVQQYHTPERSYATYDLIDEGRRMLNSVNMGNNYALNCGLSE